MNSEIWVFFGKRLRGLAEHAALEDLALPSRQNLARCRCGGSKNKPFCDGSHWYNGFTDEKN